MEDKTNTFMVQSQIVINDIDSILAELQNLLEK